MPGSLLVLNPDQASSLRVGLKNELWHARAAFVGFCSSLSLILPVPHPLQNGAAKN
jgi:hypothetical protein